MTDDVRAATDDTDDDLSWKITPRALLFLVPGYITFSNRRASGPRRPLNSLRQITLAFSFSMILVGVVLIFVAHADDPSTMTPWLVIASVVTVASLAAIEVVSRRSLDCTDETTLIQSFNSRFFARLAFADVIALVAFVASLSTDRWWFYWIFFPFALFGLLSHAPTRGQVERDQEQLNADGCNLSLVRVLLRGVAGPGAQ